jgi:RNA polymerase sigma-70 factor, ECF subfamily
VTEDMDRKTLEMASQGDPDAFSVLVERYSSRLFGTCLNYLGNRQDAEDCLQETFIKAYRSMHDYQFLSSIYTWLYRIAVNTCLDYRRKGNRAIIYSLDEAMETEDSQVFTQIADPSPLPDEQAETLETRQLIRQEISSLPGFLREIVVLRDLEGFSYHELASLLQLSEGTVKSRLSRARRLLTERLAWREKMTGDAGTKRRAAASNK